MEKFTVFEMRFDNDEIENKFHAFFHRNNLNALFTDEHRTSSIMVGLIDARAVANENGAYVKYLLDFSDILSVANDNIRYQEATFKVIHKSSNFRTFITIIKKLLEEYRTTPEEKLKNFWNAVYYNKDLF